MKRVTFVLILLAVLSVAAPVSAQTFIGTYCFKPDAFSNVWIWKVVSVADNTYTFSGRDQAYPNSAITGSVRVVAGTQTLYGNQIITDHGTGNKALHAFTLSLATNTGVSHYAWMTNAGVLSVERLNTPFSLVTCPVGSSPLPGQPDDGSAPVK
jgi:hypothetical protein